MSLHQALYFAIPAVLLLLTFVRTYPAHARSNLSFGLCNIVAGPILGAAIVAVIVPVLEPLPRLNFTWHRNTIEAYLGCLLAADLSFYLSHRFSHKVPFLWRLHRFHHSAEEMNLTVHYRHTVWSIIPNALFISLVAHLLHFHVSSVIFFFSFVSLYQLLLHSNFSHFPKFLEPLFLSPRAHHIHHDRREARKNFGGMLTIWDRLLGTYVTPSEGRSANLGVAGWKSGSQIQEWLGLDIFRAEASYLPEPASPLSHPESPHDPPPSVPQPSPPAPAIKIE